MCSARHIQKKKQLLEQTRCQDIQSGSSAPCSSGGVSMAEVPLHSERDSSRAGNRELSNIL